MNTFATHHSRASSQVFSVLFLMLCLIFAYIAAKDLLIDGIFNWHVSTPAFIQGGIELLVVLGIVLAGQLVPNRWLRAALVALPVAIYSRLHAIDFAIMISLLYALGLWAIGCVVAPLFGLAKIRDEPESWIACFLAGVIAFALTIWTASLAFGLSLSQVRIFSFCAITAAWIAVLCNHRRSGHLVALARRICARKSLPGATAGAIICAIFLAIIAKSNHAVDYDSMWYGLRPDRVLYGEYGIYDTLGLSTQIFYYPKLFEVLVSPLYGLGDNSTIIAFNAWMWVGLLATCSLISSRFNWTKAARWTFLLLAGTLPAATNIAVSAKGDLLAGALMLFATHLLMLAWTTHRLDHILLAACSVAIGVMARLSVIPYVPVLAGMAFMLVLARRTDLSAQLRAAPAGLWIMCIAAAGLTSLVFLRTYLITGLPTVAPGEAQRVLVDLGFSLKPPIGQSLDWSKNLVPPVHVTLGKILFAPSELPHILRYWVGNVWLALAVVVLGFHAANIRPSRQGHSRVGWHVLALPVLVFAMFIAILATKPFLYTGGDGNYYIYPVICLLWVLCHYITRSDRGFFDRPASRLAVLITVGFAVVLFFASASWHSGTSPFRFSPLRSPFDQEKADNQLLAKHHLQELGAALKSCPPRLRAAGFIRPPGSFGLPVRFQQFQELVWSSDFLDSTEAFSRYLDVSGTELVILPSRSRLTSSPLRKKLVNDSHAYEVALSVVDSMQHASEATRLPDVQGFEIWSLSSTASRCFAIQ